MTCNDFKQTSLLRVCLQRAALVMAVCWEVVRQLPSALPPSRREQKLIVLLVLFWILL